MLLYKDNNSNSNEYGLNFNFDLDSLSIQGENSISITNDETDYQKNIFDFTKNYLEISDKNNLSNNPQFKVKKPIPVLTSVADIIKILKEKIHADNKIRKIFNSNCNQSNEYIEKTMKEIGSLLVKRNQKIIKVNNDGKKQLGRKTKRDKSPRNHNKYSPDNIINKIKNILKKQLIIFVNNLIKSFLGTDQIDKFLCNLELPDCKSDYIIKDLDYKSLSNIKKKNENLNILVLTVQEFLSKNISSRYKSIGKKDIYLYEYNKRIIIYLLNEKHNDKNFRIFNFIFNELKIEDWLNIFIHKKELDEFSSYQLLDNEQKGKIKNCLARIENLFEDLLNEDENGVYFTCFVLLVYNYKRYYSIKKERNVKRKKINN